MNEILINQAVGILQAGGVIAYPTEAVWGLGCDPQNESAVRQLIALKQRPVEKGLIVIAANIEQLAPYLSRLTPEQHQKLQKSWPGFKTWVVPVSDSVPGWLKGNHESIALRVSAHPVVQQLCQAFDGPLVSTSANPSGQPAALTAGEVEKYFSQELALIVSGQLGGAPRPSSITDILTGKSLR